MKKSKTAINENIKQTHNNSKHEINKAQTTARPTSAFLLLYYFTSHSERLTAVNIHYQSSWIGNRELCISIFFSMYLLFQSGKRNHHCWSSVYKWRKSTRKERNNITLIVVSDTKSRMFSSVYVFVSATNERLTNVSLFYSSPSSSIIVANSCNVWVWHTHQIKRRKKKKQTITSLNWKITFKVIIYRSISFFHLLPWYTLC